MDSEVACWVVGVNRESETPGFDSVDGESYAEALAWIRENASASVAERFSQTPENQSYDALGSIWYREDHMSNLQRETNRAIRAAAKRGVQVVSYDEGESLSSVYQLTQSGAELIGHVPGDRVGAIERISAVWHQAYTKAGYPESPF